MTEFTLENKLIPLNKAWDKKEQGDFCKELYKVITRKQKETSICERLEISQEDLKNKLTKISKFVTLEPEPNFISYYDLYVIMDELEIEFREDEDSKVPYVCVLNTPVLSAALVEDFKKAEFHIEFFRYRTGTWFEVTKTEDEFKTKVQNLANKIEVEVIGQEEAVRKIVISHLIHKAGIKINAAGRSKIKKQPILIQGESGTGKTLILQTLAKIIKEPILLFDASRITSEGYIGLSSSDIVDTMGQLQDPNDYDNSTLKGIIVLDEFDKLAMGGSLSGNDIGTYGAQTNLLKLIEADTFYVEGNSTRQRVGGTFDISQIQFVFIGSFNDYLLTKAKKESKAIGFNKSKEISVNKLTPDDLQEAGIIPEIAGRIGQVINLNTLTEESLLKILSNSRYSYINQYKSIARELGVKEEKILFTQEEIDDILKKNKELKQGARGLKNLADSLFSQKLTRLI